MNSYITKRGLTDGSKTYGVIVNYAGSVRVLHVAASEGASIKRHLEISSARLTFVMANEAEACQLALMLEMVSDIEVEFPALRGAGL